MKNIWFTADLHLGHKNIIKYCNRPFDSLLEMNETIVSNWNSVVGLNDDVWLLGDVAFYSEENTYLPRLNGRINIVLGNHDKRVNNLRKNITGDIFTKVYVTFEYFSAVLTHYPQTKWEYQHEGSVNLHGHCHGYYENMDGRYDLGIDCHQEFRPFHIDEVRELIK